MDKTLFDEAIGTVPPSTVDVEGVIARQRRVERFRLSAHPWTSAAAGIAVVAFGAAAVLTPGSTTGAAVGPPEDCGSLLPTTPPLAEDETAVSTRLSHVFADAVEGTLPQGIAYGPTSAADYPVGTRHRPLDFYHAFSPVEENDMGGCGGGEDHFAAGASLIGDGINGNVLAVVGRLGGHAKPKAECGTGSVELTLCERSTRPDGAVVVITTIGGATGVRTFRADVTKPDGTGVVVQSANVTTDSKSAARPEAVAPPLTHEQLVRLALDPGLTLYPR
ncbi:hypothetical protein [Umezawaea sp. Da 62-37]|uniref:hypothetical protein n=1 Tax=Umezawaea sp. Da 62-37 TaxID=3075927 RepID=UPI0028F6C980|nr:hypothetical protein [Umezawaea sp. Da 62-37]WNV86415.1 hypothetical protein RM788_51285 [Umezawaea sp. Da 62-37]